MLTKFVPVVFCVAALTGCAAPGFDQPPTLSEVTVRVAWSNVGQIVQRCGPNKYACSTVGKPNVPFSQIWTEKPSDLRDSRKVCTLGHEFLHSLGADHID